MGTAASRCMSFDDWYDSISDAEQIEVLDELRKLAQEAGVTVIYNHLTIAYIETFATEDILISNAGIAPKFSFN